VTKVTKTFQLAATLIVSMLWIHAPSAHADLFVEFSDGTTVGNNFSVSAGSTETISIFLTESAPNTELSTDGLIGYGLRANYGATSGTSALVTGYAHNGDFNFDVANNISATDLEVAASAILVPAVTGTSVLLGQMDVQVSAIGTTVFTFDDRTAGAFSNFATESGADLDPIIFAGGRTFDLTIVGVPEPSSCAILFGLTLFGAMNRRRR